MAVFDKLTHAAKEFFIEPEQGSPAGAANGAPALTQPGQRRLDHIVGLLAGDGRDFGACVKMVKSMAAAGTAGPRLYQTAYNAFSAVNGGTVSGLPASAAQFKQALAADRDKVLARHREKTGETAAPGAAPAPPGAARGPGKKARRRSGRPLPPAPGQAAAVANPAAAGRRAPENPGRAGLLRAGQRGRAGRPASPPQSRRSLFEYRWPGPITASGGWRRILRGQKLVSRRLGV